MSPAQRRAAERRWQDWAFRRGPHPYGPEFDAVTEAIEVAAGELPAQRERVLVDANAVSTNRPRRPVRDERVLVDEIVGGAK